MHGEASARLTRPDATEYMLSSYVESYETATAMLSQVQGDSCRPTSSSLRRCDAGWDHTGNKRLQSGTGAGSGRMGASSLVPLIIWQGRTSSSEMSVLLRMQSQPPGLHRASQGFTRPGKTGWSLGQTCQPTALAQVLYSLPSHTTRESRVVLIELFGNPSIAS